MYIFSSRLAIPKYIQWGDTLGRADLIHLGEHLRITRRWVRVEAHAKRDREASATQSWGRWAPTGLVQPARSPTSLVHLPGFYNLPHYGTSGTIHLIVNNHIGFTTHPRFARLTRHLSDIAKATDAPIFHVNGDNVEAVNFVRQLTADSRAKWKKDIVIDIVCYRRHGHQQVGPAQLHAAAHVQGHREVAHTATQYSKYLVERETFTENDVEDRKKWVWGTIEKAASGAKDYELAEKTLPARTTGSTEETLKRIGKAISTYLEGFTPQRNPTRPAFGALALEKVNVRPAKTSSAVPSQRHAVILDQENEQQYVPLNALGSGQARFVICSSLLSEFGTLGFELGYLFVLPDTLTIWGRSSVALQNAQCIIDQFIASGERKWLQRTGVVMSLLYGFDGQGPGTPGRCSRGNCLG
ncbi:thiamine diphosphate-binding protein [Fomitopsis serialis]|uniref:thiamine diphosphate-binding protein n=1 Tax=Fomitopsis serialis TaxID=139415 RepID=UPI002007D1C7|nr:thiamine diphosphate-binding protein [Neoantrodia serialis]KAH9930930.1 thiamine diphosphate-binding protein [Neoantrodia serialis]